MPGSTPSVRLGIDVLLATPDRFPLPFREAGKVGLVTSDGAPPSSTSLSAREALLKAGIPIARLFAPEHGLSARGDDGAAQDDGTDPKTGLGVTSLYGERFAPPPEVLDDLDLMLFDLQDVGARFYTFLWTLSHVMEACADRGVPLWVLDRPNPLGGRKDWVEGPLPDPDAPASFLGRWPIPVRHSLTLGELAFLLREEMALDLELRVIPVEGWHREMTWPETGLSFHPPSPGIFSFASVLFYPGLALLEATNVSEGRGTEQAFRWFGAPWMDGARVADALMAQNPPGVRARPHALQPIGEAASLSGVRLEATNPGALRPVALGLRLLILLRSLEERGFRWADYCTAANPRGADHLLRLLGHRELVERLTSEQNPPTEVTVRSWTGAPGWWTRAAPHLLYS